MPAARACRTGSPCGPGVSPPSRTRSRGPPTPSRCPRPAWTGRGRRGWELIPYGGGTSVVGGVTVQPSERPVVTVDLSGIAGLRALDETSGLATFGAGTLGPAIEAALRAARPDARSLPAVVRVLDARRLGRRPVGRPGVDRLRADRAAVRRRPRGDARRGRWTCARSRPRRPDPICASSSSGSEGRLGIVTDVDRPDRDGPERDQVRAYTVPTGTGPWSDSDHRAGRTRRSRWSGVSTPLETATTLAMAADDRSRRWLRRYLGVASPGPGTVPRPRRHPWPGRRRGAPPKAARCVALRPAGPRRRRPTGRRQPGDTIDSARRTCATRCGTPGYAVDTLETATDWSPLPDAGGRPRAGAPARPR